MKPGLVFLWVTAFCGVLAAQPAVPGPEPAISIVGRYLSASAVQRSLLRGASMEVDIDASMPKLKKQGKLHALRNISKLGAITYRMLGFSGDNSVKKEVIARYLSAEMSAPQGPDISITPANYKFKFKRIEVRDGHLEYVLGLTPRKKAVGLFKGELWLDKETCMPVLETGRFVKSPSLFLKKMEFVREYALQDGVSIPQHMKSTADTRFFGPVELNVDFTNFSKTDETAEAGAGTGELQN